MKNWRRILGWVLALMLAMGASAEVGELEKMRVRDIGMNADRQIMATGTVSYGSAVQQGVRVYSDTGVTLWGHESDDQSDMYAMLPSAVLAQRFYDEIEPKWSLDAPFTVTGLLAGEKENLAYGYVQGDAQYAALVAFDDAGAILWKCVGDARTIFEAAAWTADGSVALIGHASPNPQSVWEDYEFFAVYKGGEKVSQVDYAPDTLETQGGMRPACCYTLAMLADGDGYLIARKEMMENDLELQRLDAAGARTASWTEQTGVENNFYFSRLVRYGDATYFAGAMNIGDTLLIHKITPPEA